MNSTGRELSQADLIHANLSGADLSRSDLSGAKLIESSLDKAELIETDLIHRAGLTRKSGARSGIVTFVQRFGSALNLNIHLHMMVLDGGNSLSELLS